MAEIPGTAIVAATAGGILLYAGLRGKTPLEALREVISGNPTPVPHATDLAVPGGGPGYFGPPTSRGAQIVQDARRYIGTPYKWGGASPTGFDCSGLVTYVLHHDLGLSLPSNTHTTTVGFMTWSGAKTIPAAQRQAGDLVITPSHVQIYTGAGMVIEAPGVGKKVRETKGWMNGTYRRVVV
jgi:cell wall-associated NlpC family hydrolase